VPYKLIFSLQVDFKTLTVLNLTAVTLLQAEKSELTNALKGKFKKKINKFLTAVNQF